MGHTPSQLGPLTSGRCKVRQQGKREEGSGESGNIRGGKNQSISVPGCVCPARHSEFIVSQKQNVTFHLFTLSCRLLIAWAEHVMEVRRREGGEGGRFTENSRAR